MSIVKYSVDTLLNSDALQTTRPDSLYNPWKPCLGIRPGETQFQEGITINSA